MRFQTNWRQKAPVPKQQFFANDSVLGPGKQPFFSCFLSKKEQTVRFHEALWLKIAVPAQGVFFELCLKSHLFLPIKTYSHCSSGGFRFNPV